MEIEKHGDVTIDFSAYGGTRKHLKIPLHQSARQLIEELSEIYGFSAQQNELQLQSFKALLSEQFIAGSQTLLEKNVKTGEILIIVK